MAISLEKFSIAGRAGHLEGVVHRPEEITCGIAVVAHPLPTMGGNMDNKVAVTLAKTFAELGCVALRFNFRGVGASEGEFTGGDGEEQDMIDIVHFAQEQFGEELPLILVRVFLRRLCRGAHRAASAPATSGAGRARRGSLRDADRGAGYPGRARRARRCRAIGGCAGMGAPAAPAHRGVAAGRAFLPRTADTIAGYREETFHRG